ncbi:MAG TPA: peptidoglycan DD-metalloendopeptidase family protein [Myxococcota bacterium]|nr:peptidoglycan DD-metalloendopeptidase family protein [Myxococcota bacterium]
MIRIRLALAGLVVLAAAACGSAEGPGPRSRELPPEGAPLPPVTQPDPGARRTVLLHTVAPGETLWRISKRYGTTVDAIMAANGISDVRSVATGARLRVPAAGADVPARRDDARTYASRDPRGTIGGDPHFGWPVDGEIISRFGMRHGHLHEGIDIRAPRGTRVLAAEAGRVIHADASLEGYGKMIVIKHAGRLYSVYAHNSKLLVHVGDFVEKGEAIAEVGATGNATTPHLHFEIRTDNTPRDPLAYLQ